MRAPTIALRGLLMLGLAALVWMVAPALLSNPLMLLPFLGTLLAPDVGEVQLLKFALGVDASENQTLKLFATNITPAEGDTAGTYTAAAGGGYADKTLTKTSWVVATVTGTTTGTYPAAQVFTFTGALTTNPTIYGYFVVSASGGILLWAEATTNFTPANNGDAYTITPAIQLA